MNRFVAKCVALLVTATGLAGSAVAGPVSISTGVADWKFVGFQAGVGAATGTLRTNTQNAAAAGGLAAEIAANSAWIQTNNAAFAPEAGLSWISGLSNGASEGLFGFYTYELTLTPPAVTAGSPYVISGKLSSDNLLDSFTINGVQQLTGYVTNSEFSYRVVSTLPTGSGIAPLVLRARVYNMANVASMGTFGLTPTAGTAANSTSNPTGLLLQGTAVVVPLPSAAWAGLALMGTVGCMQIRRSMMLKA
jgi:hypothetical protein